MKKKFTLIVVLLSVLVAGIAHAQRTVTGRVINMNGSPIQGASVSVYRNSSFLSGAYTNANGEFSIQAQDQDTVSVYAKDFRPASSLVGTRSEIDITLIPQNIKLAQQAALSSRSEWVGANLFYNLDGSDLDNVVGSATAQINTVPSLESTSWRLNVIGNIAKFATGVDTAQLRKDIREIAQSAQGFSLGLEPLYIIREDNDKDINIRTWLSANIKINSFQNVGKERETVNLPQGRFAIGFEFDGFKFRDGGRLLHAGVEFSHSAFSETKYEKVFGIKKSNLQAFEWMLIVPMFGKMGLLVNQTFSKGIKPVFGAGIIIGGTQKDED